MSVSIKECLMCAEHNIKTGVNVGLKASLIIGMSQLHNCVVLLDKGYSPDTEVDPLLEQYGDVEAVPECVEEFSDPE